jgi:hypothetical protein
MAEVLLRAIDNDGPEEAMYKTGDAVVVRPDGWSWGRMEIHPVDLGGEFWLIRLPGVDPAVIEPYLEPDIEIWEDEGLPDAPDLHHMHFRRKYNFNFPAPLRNLLNSGPQTFNVTADLLNRVVQRQRA